MATEEGGQSLQQCAYGCGFYGRPETNNLCSKCYRDYCLQEEKRKAVADALDGAEKVEKVAVAVSSPDVLTSECEGGSDVVVKTKDRCRRCNKLVGLLKGFKCKCGSVFCSAHRYPEEHACDFDYKAAGRDMLMKANPLIKAERLDKI